MPPPDNLASRLRTLPSDTTQVLVVHAASASSTTATLEAFTRDPIGWAPAFPAMPARVGSQGIGSKTQEGVPITPVGMFGFGPTMYGVSPDPGVHYTWHHLVAGDYWDENPASPTYNTFVHGADPGGNSEALWQIIPAYNYFAVIAFNMPDVVPGKGSGIFLHVGTGGPTAGCVSLASADLVSVLTWLQPSANPRIVISTDAGLANF
jgi:L,D-peptidoglycan transpeptidase YkuD (ErfK/YbiS/YcfS/YnhG family)